MIMAFHLLYPICEKIKLENLFQLCPKWVNDLVKLPKVMMASPRQAESKKKNEYGLYFI